MGDFSTKAIFWLYLALAAAASGLVDASYLAYAQLSIVPGVCRLGVWFNCDAVLTSTYSKVFGIPMAIFGLAWFAIAITLGLAQLSGRQLSKPMIAWGLLGLLGVIYLNYVEIGILRTICVYCLTSHILGVTFLASTILYARSHSIAPEVDFKSSS